MTPREITELAAAAPNVTVAVVGDLMLDETWTGEVLRVAPEAPVPLLSLSAMSRRAGGAGNVVENLSALGARTLALGAVGPEEEGAWLARRLTTLPHGGGSVVVDPLRTTPVKRRMVSEGRQLLRVDQEIAAGLSAAAETALLEAALATLGEADVLLVSDYAKGTLTPRLLGTLLSEARRRGVPALVDPKGRDYDRYRGATVVTPNRKELETVSGREARDLGTVAEIGSALRDRLGLDALLVKLSEEGMLLLPREGAPVRIAAQAREVFDVTGAGDTVLATLGLALGSGTDLATAATVANRAAGCAVGRVGTTPVRWADLLEGLAATPGSKRIEREHLSALSATLRRAHRRVVFTNGCFDLLHPGHVSLLAEARKLGDVLVVGLNSDESVRRLKGPSRPILSEGDRAQVLGGLDAVDFVVVFGEDTPEEVIRTLRPQVLVKGGDYTEATVVGAPFVRSYGGEVALIPLVAGRSTTNVVERIRGE
ncbi:D-glycero-beta-D-manno-heptose 1-phosphate adenylyltransferase [Acidobacteria bacterium ACD]|nr:MAG: D-glycero-beta-D-manno-heptose 1-phosphate adenylyltransferase [Acidobacteriota bacterium]MCE7958583.1 D-glycero-beta-D-manno-heptose 1-phosphate adenylyltransferase [Acidobacteria bacterium ACB2]MDL1951571.1 D-glycero-beta-D-manno-heptose 1-phosphate adenylyltransferase [Acidobacteria bacterium ACD]